MMVEPLPSPRAFDIGLPPLRLEAGIPLPRLHLRGWWWGPASDLAELERRVRPADASEHPVPDAPSSPPLPAGEDGGLDERVPTVLLLHALTGDARAGGPGGWWAPVIGPDRALDPSRCRLLCFNNLGSCYGSFGPNAADWPRLDGAGQMPAPVTTWDQARAILRALDALGLGTIDVAVGGSLGAMILLALGALAPERFRRLVPVAGSEAASPWIIGYNHVARQTILQDPTWPVATRGLELARQLAQMTYRAEPGLTERQGRRVRSADPDGPSPFTEAWSPHLPYAQQTYLEHQGRKLAARFDAPSYVVQLGAMDHHDLQRRPPEPEAEDGFRLPSHWDGRARLPARLDAIGIDSDVLYPPEHMRRLAEARPQGRYHAIQSAHGHDAFLIEWDQLDPILRSLGAPFSESKR